MSKTITFESDKLPRLHAVISEAVRMSKGGVTSVAKSLGVSRTTIHRWQKTRSQRINRDTVRGLCRLTGQSYRSLFTPAHRGTGVTTVTRNASCRRLMDHAKMVTDTDTDVVSCIVYWAIARRNENVSHVMTRVDGAKFNKIAVTRGSMMCVLSIWQDAVGFNYKVTMTNSLDNIFSDSGHTVVSGRFKSNTVQVPVAGMFKSLKAVTTVIAMKGALG